jgi:hypothetical protein
VAVLGAVAVSLAATPGAQGAEERAIPGERQEVSQYGITWRFDRAVRSGQFVNGDWWVVGPVSVVGITPAPGPAPDDASVDIRRDQWGNTSLSNDNRMRNGSMVILNCGPMQGYDSRSAGYDPASSVKLPYRLEANRSLVSTISNTSLPIRNFVHKLMWSSEQTEQVVIGTAAVLTCLASEPPADAFRPPCAGAEKPIYRTRDLKWDLLLRLEPAGPVPSWEDFERYFQRAWLDHIPSWVQRGVSPNENQPAYGREHGRLVSIASLMVHLNVPRERKEKLVIGLVQLGIDLSGLAKVGGNWNQGGGHGSGRKWPILFASLMLDKPELRKLPASAVFHEDAQTYYGKGWFGQTALWQMVEHHGPRQPYEEKPPEQWEEWDQTSEGYRVCCTAVAWTGTALAARLMRAIPIWEHDAFFDYCDRWMRPDDPYAAARAGFSRPREETRSFDPFVDEMWRAYRASAPTQPYSEKNLKWVWEGDQGKWAPNPRPQP